MICTTLNKIKAHKPCEPSYKKLCTFLKSEKGFSLVKDRKREIPFAWIVESNGLNDALWACCAAPEYDREWRLFAVWCARQVQHLMTDPRSIAALDVAERFANGEATQEELAAASDAAWDARWDAASAAASAAASDATSDATWYATWYAARAAARDAQRVRFLELVGQESTREVAA